MKHIASLVVLVFAMSSLTGCLIRTRGHAHGGGNSRARSCPPSSHWNGNACVHNGRGRGHGPPVRDHRR